MFKQHRDNTKDVSKPTSYDKSRNVAGEKNKPISPIRRGRVDKILALDEMQENINKWHKEQISP